MAYDPSGNWIDAQGHNLGPAQWSDNLGGFWFTLNAAQKGFERVPPPPTTVNTDPAGPGGAQTTADPLNPGFWYRDNAAVSGGLQRIDEAGNVVGTFAPGPASDGGRGFNLYARDPATGGPQAVQYAQDAGGLFGLGDVWGSVVGVALVAALGLTAGLATPAVVGAEGAAVGAEAGAAGAAGVTGAEAAGVAGEGALFASTPSTAAGVGAGLTAGEVGGGAGAISGGAGATSLLGEAGGDALAAGGEVTAAGDITTSASTLSDLEAAIGDIPASESGGSFFGSGGTLSDIRNIYGVAGPLVSAAGALIGGANSASAARDAANTQANAANAANATLGRIYDQSRADLAPYRAVGTAALGQLAHLTDTPFVYPPFDPQPYAFTPPSGQQVLNDDPSYAWRVSEGQKAIERSGAAKGLQLSGGQLKDLQRFSQGLASTEYQAAYGRRLQQNQLAYDRGFGAYTTNFNTLNTLRNTRYNELAGLAGTGQTSINATNQLAANTGTQLAANTTSAGAAQAGGQIGAANALNAGITGVGSALNQYNQFALLSSLANRKAA